MRVIHQPIMKNSPRHRHSGQPILTWLLSVLATQLKACRINTDQVTPTKQLKKQILCWKYPTNGDLFILFVKRWLTVCTLCFSVWQFNRKRAAKKVAINGFQGLLRVVLMCYCDRVVSVCTVVLNFGSGKTTVTPELSPSCLPHSALRLKLRHPSTLAPNTTTFPPPAAKGWGKKHHHCEVKTHSWCTNKRESKSLWSKKQKKVKDT